MKGFYNKPAEDGIDFDEETLIGITKSLILEKRVEKKPKFGDISWFNKYTRIIFLSLGNHNYDPGCEVEGYGMEHILHGPSSKMLQDWGFKDPKRIADFILETITNENENEINKCGIMIPGGHPIYRINIKGDLKCLQVYLSEKGGIIDISESHKGFEYFKIFPPETAPEYQFKRI